MKQTVSEQALALVEKRLTKMKGRLTVQDAAAATGLIVGEAEGALMRLMELYVTRITTDQNGTLLFAFDLPLRRRGTKTAREKFAEVRDALWQGFKRFYKIWIGVMLIAYFGVMLLLLLLLMLALSAANRSDDDDSGGGDLVGGLFRVMIEGLRFAFIAEMAMPMGYATDDYGSRYRKPQSPRGISRNGGKSFVIAIYDLALGPARAEVDPFENRKEAAEFLRTHEGVLTAAEIVALSGGTIDEAEKKFADYLVRFNGEPRIDDDGVVIGEFDRFIEGAESDATGGRIVEYWDEFEAPYELTGNSTGRNAGIVAMIIFTLVMGAVMSFGGLHLIVLRLHKLAFLDSGIARVLLGYVPMAFSMTFLLLPPLRRFGVTKREAERRERNRGKKVMRAIFTGRLWSATADQIYYALLAQGDKDFSREDVTEILRKLALELGGDVGIGDDLEVVFSFDRLRREYDAANKMRSAKR